MARGAPSPAPAPATAQPPSAGIRVAAVGDIMLGTDYPENHLPDDDGESFLSGVAAILGAADLTFGNLEGVLMDGGEPRKQCQTPELCYLFRTPTRYTTHLLRAGFDVISLANNHTRDFGEEGRSATVAALDRAGIRHSGREGDVASWTVRGLPTAVIAFAPTVGSHSLLEIEAAAIRVRELSDTHAITIVSFHGGAEGLDATHVPFEEEFFYGEARGDVVRFSHAVIDAGADLVIGHGPHVPRALELYGDRLIAYSLGNFATYYGISVAGIRGLAPILIAELGSDGRFLGGQIVSAHQIRPGGPTLDPERKAFKLIRALTEEDFGQAGIRFEDKATFHPLAADVSRE